MRVHTQLLSPFHDQRTGFLHGVRCVLIPAVGMHQGVRKVNLDKEFVDQAVRARPFEFAQYVPFSPSISILRTTKSSGSILLDRNCRMLVLEASSTSAVTFL